MFAKNHAGGSGNCIHKIAIAIAGSVQIERPEAALLVGRHASSPAFLGLKWAAFQDVGEGDLFGSRGIEGVLVVLAFRPTVAE